MLSAKNQAKPKYLTPDSTLGKFALQYMYKTCETALSYCQEQGLTEFKDFASAVTTISEEQNPNLKINTAISETGIAMKLAKKPDLGYTTGTYLMKHLGFEGEEQKKFTRRNVEAFLSPEAEMETNNSLQKLLENQLQNENPNQNHNLRTNFEDLDDLLDSEKISKSSPSKLSQQKQKSQSQNQPVKLPEQPLKKKSLDIDNILNRAAEISMTTTAQTNEVDGLALGGLASTTTILAAVVGKKAAKKIVNAAQKLKRQGQVAKIAARLKAAQERANELIEREEQLAEFIEKSSEENQSEKEESKKSFVVETKEETEENTPGEILAQAISDIEQRITQSQLNEKKIVHFTIDKNADFDEQLKQINTALNRIEQRLEELEKRITALEKLMENPSQSQPVSSPLNFESNNQQSQITSQTKPTLPTENNDTDTTETTDASSPPQASNPAIACASTLLMLYNQAEEQAIACADSLEDGVLLGDDAVLFVDREADSIKVSIEHFNGEELFLATLTDEEWTIERDRLSEETKDAIASLSERDLEFESIKPDNKKERTSSEIEM
ncbi:MAG: hypothetical protein MUD14_00605 [Hydrococcus sp. Prado102]|jgi:hypothetical protein|nr:hypothetical protein [Hydrococcus sp. Prado102]